jgi:hypothetical protein
MSTIFGGDVHAGLSGIELDGDYFELGDGITLRKTYTHLMAHFVMAFKPPPPGSFHPGPWKPASGGFTFDVSAELTIPAHYEKKFGSTISVARTIVFLLRLWVNPATTLAVFSNFPFGALPDAQNNEARLLPFEVQDRHFPLGVVGGRASADALEWVKDHWTVTHQLLNGNSEFALAVEAIDTGQFVQSTALALVSQWGALEALFSPSTSELKFRVSALIAAFLEPPGAGRATLQKEIAKLYDKRSAAAHGKPKHQPEDLLATFNLLRRVLIEIIGSGKVPSKDDLEGILFGYCSADG